jgi:hypothetical protein
LDISFWEEDSLLCKDLDPENLTRLQRLAASLPHNEKQSKGGVACKRKQAGWDNDYFLKVLGTSSL